jgi:hypothetical protein
MRSAVLSCSHETFCVDGKLDRYPNRACGTPSQSGGVAPLFCGAPAPSRRYARWGRPYFQQFFGAMPRRIRPHCRRFPVYRCVQVMMPGEHQVDCVDDVVQEIFMSTQDEMHQPQAGCASPAWRIASIAATTRPPPALSPAIAMRPGLIPRDSRYRYGGGYVIGSLVSHRHLVSEAGRAAKIWALALDYRLAPCRRKMTRSPSRTWIRPGKRTGRYS